MHATIIPYIIYLFFWLIFPLGTPIKGVAVANFLLIPILTYLPRIFHSMHSSPFISLEYSSTLLTIQLTRNTQQTYTSAIWAPYYYLSLYPKSLVFCDGHFYFSHNFFKAKIWSANPLQLKPHCSSSVWCSMHVTTLQLPLSYTSISLSIYRSDTYFLQELPWKERP